VTLCDVSSDVKRKTANISFWFFYKQDLSPKVARALHLHTRTSKMPRFSRAPPVVLDACRCPGGEGVDFIDRLPAEVYRRILMHLPGRQLAQAAVVNKAWSAASQDDALWAGTYDVSYGSKAAEHLAAISVGDEPPQPRGNERSNGGGGGGGGVLYR
jgi:hypothetical protein